MLVEVLRTFNILPPMQSNDTRNFRTRVGVLKYIEEIRPDAAIAPSIAVTHDSWRGWFGTEQRHEGIVERTHGLRIANPHIDVAEQRKGIFFKIAQACVVQILICLHLTHSLSPLRSVDIPLETYFLTCARRLNEIIRKLQGASGRTEQTTALLACDS